MIGMVTQRTLDYRRPDGPTRDDRAWIPSIRSVLVVGVAIVTVLAAVAWAEHGIRFAQAHEPTRYLDLMPRSRSNYYEHRYLDIPVLVGTIVHAALALTVIVCVGIRRWPTRSLLLLIVLFISWLVLVLQIVMIGDRAMT